MGLLDKLKKSADKTEEKAAAKVDKAAEAVKAAEKTAEEKLKAAQAATKAKTEAAAAEAAQTAKRLAAEAKAKEKIAAREAEKAAAEAAAAAKKVEDLAKEVIRGDWGNGQERYDKLTAAGYNYDEVQGKVNEILSGKAPAAAGGKSVDELAREVIRGNWGNGQERYDRLTAAGYDYNAVQKRVNELLK